MRPPKLLHVNPLATTTDSGVGLIGYRELDTAINDVLRDRINGCKTKDEIWIYELKQVKKVVIVTENTKGKKL